MILGLGSSSALGLLVLDAFPSCTLSGLQPRAMLPTIHFGGCLLFGFLLV